MAGIIEIAENGFWKNRQSPDDSLRYTANLFDEIGGKIIVEIGTGIHGDMSGNSVMIWSKNTKAEKIYCLDLESKHIEDVQKATKDYPSVIAIQENGIDFLKRTNPGIDLLYLDFWVHDKKGDLTGIARANAYLEAYHAAKSKLSATSLILIDDTDHVDPWKQSLIVPEARKDGFTVLYCGRQTLMMKSED